MLCRPGGLEARWCRFTDLYPVRVSIIDLFLVGMSPNRIWLWYRSGW